MEKKLKIEKELSKIAAQILKRIGKTKPGIKTKIMFQIMRMNQKANNWNPTDKEHWSKNGWLDKSKPW